MHIMVAGTVIEAEVSACKLLGQRFGMISGSSG